MTARWDYVSHRGRVGIVTMDLGAGCVRVRFCRSRPPKGQVREATVRADQLREATDTETQRAKAAGLTREAERSRLPADRGGAAAGGCHVRCERRDTAVAQSCG